jgi:hypothetical protein
MDPQRLMQPVQSSAHRPPVDPQPLGKMPPEMPPLHHPDQVVGPADQKEQRKKEIVEDFHREGRKALKVGRLAN